MSTAGGTQDWFYHAPDRKNSEPVEYPAVSQIPGLSSLAQHVDDEYGAKVGWIKDTDSKYIQLAKMGGRKDLLRHKENGAPNSEAKAYPRCEWFDYHEYPGSDDTGPHRSYLPDYMVYKEYNPQDNIENRTSGDKPRRPPYSLGDNLSAFQRDGDSVTDKTIKLPEIDRQYKKGVVFKVHKAKMSSGVRPTECRGQQNKGRYQTRPSPPKEQNVSFSKLMSMSYQDEWLKQREEITNQLRMQELQKNKDCIQNKNNRITTEYREIICKDQNQKPATHSVPKVRHTKASEGRRRRDSEENKELFKLNRFTKVGARVDSHWHQADDSYSRQLAAVHI